MAEATASLLEAESQIEAEKARSHKRLENTALRATLWTIIAYGLSQVLRMCSSIVLTRLLLPQYFGLMALVSTVLLGLNLLSDIGLLPSVIGSARGDEPVFLNTAWTLQIVRGTGLWVISLLIAHPVALFYHDARLNMMIPVLGLTSVISGFNGTSLLTAARHIGVRRIYVLDVISQLITVLATATWALLHPTVWALVGGNLIGAAVKALLSHMPFVMPGHRNWFAWESDSLNSLIRFGKWILLGTAFYFFGSQADRLILGKLVSFTILGIYGVAYTISDVPRQIISQFASRVGFPFVAKLKHLPAAEFYSTVLRYRRYCLLVGGFLLTIVVMLGPVFVRHVYDARYRDASWMIPVLALGLWHTLMYSTTGTILFSIERPVYNAIGTGCYCASMFIFLPLAYHAFGLFGAVVAVAAGDFPFYLVIEIGAAREKISVWRQDLLMTGAFLAMLTVAFTISHFVK